MMTKKEIRKEAKERIAAGLESQEEWSREAAKHAFDFIESFDLRPATCIGIFLSMKGTEIETAPLITLLKSSPKGYRLLVPRVDDETTIRFYPYSEDAPHKISKYGIWEPLAETDEALTPEIIIVPGLAFDRKRGRVGHGKGFYDRFFERHNSEICLKAALAFECQTFDEVPTEDYDFPMDALITERGVTRFF